MFWAVAVINPCSLINFNLRNFAFLNPINSFASLLERIAKGYKVIIFINVPLG
jgi:hypothetical protein